MGRAAAIHRCSGVQVQSQVASAALPSVPRGRVRRPQAPAEPPSPLPRATVVATPSPHEIGERMGEDIITDAAAAPTADQECVDMEGEAAPAPRTPKRDERPGQGDASPSKTRRGEHERTNAELLDFMRGMQATADRRFQDIAACMDRGERRQDQLEQAVGTRLDVVEARVEDMARQNQQGMTVAQRKNVEDRFQDQKDQIASEEMRRQSRQQHQQQRRRRRQPERRQPDNSAPGSRTSPT